MIAKVIELLNQKVADSDICIICRTNDDVLRLAQKLNTYQIPCQMFIADQPPASAYTRTQCSFEICSQPS